MVIDERDAPEAIRHGFQRGHIAMLVGAEWAPRLGLGQEPVEELVRCAEMKQRDRPRFAIDAARLHAAGVGVSTRFDFLNACQRLSIQGVRKRVKPWKIRKRASEGLCIHLLKGQKKPKSGRIKDFAPSPSWLRSLLPESRASREYENAIPLALVGALRMIMRPEESRDA